MEHTEIQSTPTPPPDTILHSKELDNLFGYSREVVMYVVYDERLTVKAISDSISTYGYAPDDFATGERSLRDITYHDDWGKVTDFMSGKLQQGAKSFGLDFRIVDKTGNPVWITCAMLPEYNQDGIATDFLVKVKDITHRIQRVEKLLAEKNCLQVLGDYFPNGCLFRMEINNQAKKASFLYVSKTWEKMTNTTVGDVLQDADITFSKIQPDDLQRLMDGIWGPPGALDNVDSEIRYFFTKDDMRWLQISTHRHVENDQMLLDGLIIDITDRKRAEAAFGLYQDELERLVKERTAALLKTNQELESANKELLASNQELEKYRTQLEEMVASKTLELNQAKEKAEESDMLKSAFLANMSHEIRTPLNGIVGFLNFLTSDNLSYKRKEEYINVIKNSSMQLVKLIDDIIDLAKIEARQMSINPIPLHVNELMRELQMFFETFLQSKNKSHIAMILDESESINACITFVDPLRLRQTLSNLISNAIKFTEKGYIRFGYRQTENHTLEFMVEDTGIGLAADRLNVIFERFRQAEPGTNHRYGGTGLGLTISRSLVQLMGGDLRVESVDGVGSTFFFTISYIPVVPEDECFFDELHKVNSPGKIFENKTILLVEQEIMKRQYYERLLSATGLSVIQVESLQQWLDSIGQATHFNAIMADIRVFDHADDEIIRQIKPTCAGVPVILFIPGQINKYRLLIHDSRCNMALEEPLHHDELLKILVKYIRQKSYVSDKATTLQKQSTR